MKTHVGHFVYWASVLFASATLSVAEAARPMHFDHLTLADGLSQNSVMGIHQDSMGFLWFATENGLNRYDGYTVRNYFRNRRDPSALQSDYIWTIAEDAAGNIWLATEGAGVVRWQRSTDSFHGYIHDPQNEASLSSDITRTLLLDDDGYVWVGTRESGLDRLNPATGEVLHFRHESTDPNSLSSNQIYAVYADRFGALWIGTEAGLNRLDSATGRIERFVHDAQNPNSLSSDAIITIFEDRAGTLWIGTFDGGLNRFDRETELFQRYRHDPADLTSLSNDHVRVIFEESQGRFWVGTENGLNLMDRDSGTFERYRHSATEPQSLGDSYVMSISEDRSGALWVGTRAAGASKWNTRSWSLGHYRDDWLSDRDVTSFAEEDSGHAWVGTFGGGVALLDQEMNRTANYSMTDGLSDDAVMSLLKDSHDALWIGTMTGGLNRLDAETDEIEIFRFDADDNDSLSADGIMSLHEDTSGNIWIGTFGGGVSVFSRDSGTFRRYSHEPNDPNSLSNPRATAITHDKNGNIWIGTQGGGLNLFNEELQTFHRFVHQPDDPNSLSSDTVYALHVDEEGVLWVGTAGGGLDKMVGSSLSPGEIAFENLSTFEGLPSNVIYGVLSDRSGNLWLSSNNGLVRYHRATGRIKTIHASHGLQGDEFNFGAHHQGASGKLFFGGANGFNAFDPGDIDEMTHAPSIVLTAFEKLNQPAETNVPYELLETVDLGYRDDVVTFEFAALDFIAPDMNKYEYRLEGFDRDWVELGNRRRVTYTNLAGRDYVLQVRAANSDGVWNQAGLSIPVHVTPAPWKTSWAYYSYLAAGLLFFFLLWRHHRLKLMREAGYSRKLEQQVRERTNELEARNSELSIANQSKSQFLARMSHEIRTPMNGVLGMTELLLGTKLNEKQNRFANTIRTSAESLLEIINDILDFSKIEAGKLKLEEIEFDLIDMVEDAAELLAGPAAEKGLDFICATPPKHVPRVLGDPLRLRQVLINLIGNAIKFTPSGEVIARFEALRETNDAVEVRFEVEDSGVGISRENQAFIFDCFSQEDDSTTRRFGGTGLGLAISRQLIELMDGQIGVESVAGEGSTFWFSVTMKKAKSLAPIRWAAHSVKNLRVLVVDGSQTHKRVLQEQLSAWQVNADCVNDREEALAMLKSAIDFKDPYDLAILDVCEPTVDGEPLLREIRRTKGLENLKLIVMTPIATSTSILDGYAVDYCLTKPIRQSCLYDSLIELSSESGSLCHGRGTDVRRNAISGNTRILLVEDNSVNQAVAIGMLNLLGCNVESVDHGEAAVERLTDKDFDLVLMDCQMPVMDGFEATMEIRSRETAHKKRRTPIVAVTASALDEDRERCRAAGMDDHLSKPYTLQALYSVLTEWLPSSTLQATADEAPERALGHEQLIDQSAIQFIRELESAGNPGMVSRVVELYLASSAELMSKLEHAFDQNDAPSMAHSAHTLKSSSANLGATAFADLCQVLEATSKSGDLEKAEGLVVRLKKLYPRIVAALELELKQKSA